MPYYRWCGIDLHGSIKKGMLFATSLEHLDRLLIKREIALLHAQRVKRWFKKPITIADRTKIIAQLATLIDAGILLPDALDIIANQVDHPELQEIMHQVAKHVMEGSALSAVLVDYPSIANHLTIQLIKAGEESGQLAQVLTVLYAHLNTLQDFYRRVRSALLLPAITLLFFCIIFMIIFIAIIPHFVTIFTAMGTPISPLTQYLIIISEFIRTPLMGLIIAIIILMVIILWRITRRAQGRAMLDKVVLTLPFVGTIVQQRFLAYAMQAVSVLLASGIPLLEALNIIYSSVQNHVLKRQIGSLIIDIESGSSLSDAMARHASGIFSQDIVAMVEIAEASGRLPLLLDRVARIYDARIADHLALFTLLLQPFIMIILGLLVAVLIFAIYTPIFTLSSSF